MILGMNWVAVARIGLILGQNEAMGSRKVFRGLLDLWDIKKTKKQKSKIQQIRNITYISICIYIYILESSGGASRRLDSSWIQCRDPDLEWARKQHLAIRRLESGSVVATFNFP